MKKRQMSAVKDESTGGTNKNEFVCLVAFHRTVSNGSPGCCLKFLRLYWFDP